MGDRVSPEEAKRLVDEEGYVYVDVRSVPEFEQGHPTGAYNIPLLHMEAGGMQPNPHFVNEVRRAFPDPATKIVLGCRSGNRSLNAMRVLEGAGYTALVDQRAGLDGARDAFGRVADAGWRAQGLPVSTEPLEGRGYADLIDG